jgi:hypothetical protein
VRAKSQQAKPSDFQGVFSFDILRLLCRPSPTVSPRPFEPSSRHQLHSPRSAPHLWQQDQSAHDTRDRVASIPPYRSAHKVPIPRALNAAGAPYSRPGSREGTAKSRASTTKNSPTAECGSHRGTTAAGVDTPSGVVKAEASLEDAEGRRFIAHPHSVRSLVSEEPQSAPQQATRPSMCCIHEILFWGCTTLFVA